MRRLVALLIVALIGVAGPNAAFAHQLSEDEVICGKPQKAVYKRVYAELTGDHSRMQQNGQAWVDANDIVGAAEVARVVTIEATDLNSEGSVVGPTKVWGEAGAGIFNVAENPARARDGAVATVLPAQPIRACSPPKAGLYVVGADGNAWELRKVELALANGSATMEPADLFEATFGEHKPGAAIVSFEDEGVEISPLVWVAGVVVLALVTAWVGASLRGRRNRRLLAHE